MQTRTGTVRHALSALTAIAGTSLFAAALCCTASAQVDTRWKIHDMSRPVPPVVTPGTASTQEAPGRAPSDAVVLFDGKDLSQWQHK
ncbi:MAG TPA: hypothetical protein VJP87_02180, partial [Candidatus Acidoferrales bacterium]|nr:hypothetical protein [Candidatus Acidoferrales bacterium]